MTERPASEVSSGESSPAERLDSWKEIASYLRRSVSSVKRWEKEEGLPVRRHPHGRRGSVYAYREELDAWWAERGEAANGEPAETGPTSSRRWWILSGAAAALTALLIAGLAWRELAADAVVPGAELAFEERDFVLIADFENRTGEEALDGAVEAALARELSVSGFVNVMPRVRIDDALRLMRLPVDSPVDRELARQVCLRDPGAKALLTGRLERLGGNWALSAELVDPTDGVTVTSLSEEASHEEELAAAIRRLAGRVRESLGEEIARIRESQAELSEVTTPSLEALKLYTEADAATLRAEHSVAEALLREAIRLDPDFASAWTLLGYAIYHQGPDEESRPYFAKGLELADEATDVERLFSEGSYFGLPLSNPVDETRAIQSYRALHVLRPDHFWGVNNLALSVRRREGRRAALPYILHAVTLRPNDVWSNFHAANTLASLGRHEETAPYIERIRSVTRLEEDDFRGPPSIIPWVRLYPAYRHWLRGEVEETERILDREVGSLVARSQEVQEAYAPLLYSSYAAMIGQRDKALEIMRTYGEGELLPFREGVLAENRDSAATHNLLGRSLLHHPFAAGLEPVRVLLLGRAGHADEARAGLEKFSEVYPNHPKLPVMEAAVAWAEGRDVDDGVLSTSTSLAREGRVTFPFFVAVSMLADQAVRRGDVERAVDALEKASATRERLYPGVGGWFMAEVRLVRAYELLGRAEEARAKEAELRRLLSRADSDFWVLCYLDHPGERCTAEVRGLDTWPAPPASEPRVTQAGSPSAGQ